MMNTNKILKIITQYTSVIKLNVSIKRKLKLRPPLLIKDYRPVKIIVNMDIQVQILQKIKK